MAVEKLKTNYKAKKKKKTWANPQIKTIISATNSDDDLLWNGSEEVRNVRSVSVRKMKALTVKLETVTLIGKGRWNMTCSVYLVYEINSRVCS